MRRVGRTVRIVYVNVALLAGGAAVSGYGGRALSALRAASWDLDIERAMDAVGVAPGMVVGEAGAGDGYFTLPMARRVGAAGAVYANDISRRALDQLTSNARRERLDNVHIVEGDTDDPRFPRRDLELVVIVHAFHDFSQPVEWLRNVRQYLRPGATVAIIDRDPSQGAETHFWPRDRILGYAEKAGFEPVKVVDGISRHLIIVIRPVEPGV
jgi:ubiquinone/menaquinone biosynthesis C-methylase UbiE